MPSAINGFGTMYYGRRDSAPDGSYLTTKWIVLSYLPVFPLGSYRVRPIGGERWGWLPPRASQSYSVRPEPLNWPQIANVYSIVVGIVLLIVLAFRMLESLAPSIR